jgi:hypothetical protein
MKYGIAAAVAASVIAVAACGGDDAGGDRTAFCDAAASYEQSGAPNPSTASAAELEAAFADAREALDRMEDTSPDEIADDVTTVATTMGAFFEALAGHDYDYDAFINDPDGLAAADALSSAEMATATGNIERFIADECEASR